MFDVMICFLPDLDVSERGRMNTFVLMVVPRGITLDRGRVWPGEPCMLIVPSSRNAHDGREHDSPLSERLFWLAKKNRVRTTVTPRT